MGKSLIFAVWLISLSQAGFAQIWSNGTGGGPWNLRSTWLGGKVPVGGNSAGIIIRSGDVVQIPAGYSVSIDQMTIEAGATVRVLSGGLMTIANGAGTDLVIENNGAETGVLTVAGRLALSQSATTAETGTVSSPVLTSATTTIQNGGIYSHNYFFSAGTVIGANWEDGSLCEIRRLTTPDVIPGNLNQNYYDFIWDCPGQRSHLDLGGNLETVRNNLTIGSTGGYRLKVFGVSSNNTLDVGGNLVVQSDPLLYFSDGGTGNVVNIAGDFINSSSSVNIYLASAGSVEFNVAGDFLYTNPSGRMFLGNASGAFTRLNLYSDVQILGQFRTNNGGRGYFEFLGDTEYSGTPVFIGAVNFTIHPGARLDLGTSFVSNYSGTFRLRTGGTLAVGATNGAGTNALGAIQANNSQGNVRTVVASRVYEAGSTIVYNGVAAQQIGNGHPNGINLIIDNPTSVSLLRNLSAVQVNLEQGALATGNFTMTVTADWVVNGGVLSPGASPLVFNGTSDVTGTGSKNFGNVIVQSGATASFPDEDITITGNLTVDAAGTLQPNLSNIVLTGATDQSIFGSGTTFHNITVNKPSGSVTLTSLASLRNLLDIQSATTFNSNGNLVLLSTGDKPAVDAAIGALPAGAGVTGNVIVQRYMGAIGKNWRFISSPVQNTPLADLKDDFKVATTSLRYYDPLMINTDPNDRFRVVPAKSTTYTLEEGRGYSAYMWVDGVVNLDFTGVINAGAIDLPVVRGNSTPPNPAGDGWNLVGNPYPSAIVWDGGSGWTLQNVSSTVGVEVAGSGGVWNYYNYVDNSGDLTNGVIATGQGFWVYAYAGNPSIEINEQAKTNIKGGSYYRSRSPEQSRQLIVALHGEQGMRKAFFKLHSEATRAFDQMLDAYPIPIEMLEGFNISLLDREASPLLMHTIREMDANEEVPLQITVPAAGEFVISFPNHSEFPFSKELFLQDKLTGVSVSVSSGDGYRFHAQQAGVIQNRFLLTTQPGREQTPEELVHAYPNPFTSRFTIEVASSDPAVAEIIDARGQRLSTYVFTSRVDVETTEYLPGVYFAKVKTSEGVVIRKLMKR